MADLTAGAFLLGTLPGATAHPRAAFLRPWKAWPCTQVHLFLGCCFHITNIYFLPSQQVEPTQSARRRWDRMGMEQDHLPAKAAEVVEFPSKHCRAEMSHPSHISCLADHLGLVHWPPPALPPFRPQEGGIILFPPLAHPLCSPTSLQP